jgi:hypothetical protein
VLMLRLSLLSLVPFNAAEQRAGVAHRRAALGEPVAPAAGLTSRVPGSHGCGSDSCLAAEA